MQKDLVILGELGEKLGTIVVLILWKQECQNFKVYLQPCFFRFLIDFLL